MIRPLHAIALLLVAGLCGCGTDSSPTAPRDAVLTKVSGDGQQVPAGSPEPAPLVVSVTNPYGDPLSNVEVTWRVISGGGTLSASSSMTDETGKASVTWTLGPSSSQSVKAWIGGGPLGVTFTADPILQLMTIAAGDAQKGPFGEPLPTPLVALVTTLSGQPIPNVKVNWGVVAGGGSVSSPSSITDPTGRASITWTLGTVINETVKAWTDVEGSQSVLFSATGEKTLVLHYDGASWTRSLLTENTSVSVSSGWAGSQSIAFAAGGWCQNPFVLTYNNGAWSGMEKCSGSSLVVTSMWGNAPNDVWAVAGGNTTRLGPRLTWVYHFNGSSWTVSYTDGDASHAFPDLLAVGTRSTDDVIAVGRQGRIVRHAGSQWLEQSSGTTSDLFAVWGDPNSASVFAVGDGGTVIYHDGTSWRGQTSGTTAQLRSVWGSSSTDVFAVGANGTILHFDGSSWSAQASGTTQDLRSVWGISPTSVYAVGGSAVLHYDGTSWSAVPMNFKMTFTSVWGTSSSNVFVSGAPVAP